MMKIDAGDCLPLDAVAHVSAQVSNVVACAMHRDKSARYRGAAELEAAWREARKA